MKTSNIECGLSGITSTQDDALDTEDYDGNDADLPEGWTKITITHRRSNPAWEAVQEVKELTGANLLAQVDPKIRGEIEPIIMVQMEAQFAALEARSGYSRTLLEEHIVFVAPHTRAEGLEAEIQDLAAMLGLDPNTMLADDVEDDIDRAKPDEELDEADQDDEPDEPAESAESAEG